MEFGKGKFTLDKLKYLNKPIGTQGPTQLKIGMPIWNHSEWKNTFYSQNCPVRSFLPEFSKRLNCSEVSSTFYAPVAFSTIKKWIELTDDNFKFLPKWPKIITHDLALRSCDKEIKSFIDTAYIFNEKLGLTLLQMPPNFSVEYKRDLFLFLQKVPKDLAISIEFRHESWFEQSSIYKKLESYMNKESICSVITDTPGKREVFHESFTGNKTIIRYLSDEILENDIIRLNNWKKYFELNDKLGEIYFIIHSPNNTRSPELIQYLHPKLHNKIVDLNTPQQYLI